MIEKIMKDGSIVEILFRDNATKAKDPVDLIIIEGVHALQFEEINKLADLKIMFQLIMI
jgi:uridine kinase